MPFCEDDNYGPSAGEDSRESNKGRLWIEQGSIRPDQLEVGWSQGPGRLAADPRAPTLELLKLGAAGPTSGEAKSQ